MLAQDADFRSQERWLPYAILSKLVPLYHTDKVISARRGDGFSGNIIPPQG